MTVTATAKRCRREAKLDKRFRARVREKSPLNTFLGNTSKKKRRGRVLGLIGG